jgi:hypothetical protein
MSNSNLLLLIIAGLVALFVLHITSSNSSSKSAKSSDVAPVAKQVAKVAQVSSPASPASPASTVSSPATSVSTASTASTAKKEKFTYSEVSEGYENNLELEGFENIDNIEHFQAKNSSESPKPESVVKSAKLGNTFGGGEFRTKLTGAGGQVGPNTTNVNGLSLEGAPDFTLGVTPVISKEKKAKKLTAKDLLPKEAKDDWFDMPYDKKQMMRIENENLLAGASTQARIGIDTQGQTLKNASHDLRAAPPNPKFNVGPWNNSTIEPDYNIKPIM